jgi:multiple RNA-binding domain-containing protein 1
VEYLEAQDARRAFTKFAYFKFNNVPLYLEWAPVGMLQKPKNSGANKDDEHEEMDDDSTQTLYLANLPFSATEAHVKQLFGKNAAEVRTVTLKEGKGIAFVEFKTPQAAAKALNGCGNELQGRPIIVQFSKAKKTTTSGPGKCPPGCNPLKLLVRNVPFEATIHDLRKLFSAHSQFKTVSLPKKVDEYDPLTGTKNPHRGFAFVEFLTQDEARNAMQLCSSTHLYGRHLVLEYAKEGSTVNELRDKAKRKSLSGLQAQNPPLKKLRTSPEE